MIQRKIKENITELSAEVGYIHKKGSELYFKKGVVVGPTDEYEEVEDKPKYTSDEYVHKVRELIKEKYSIEDEIAINRQRDTKPIEFEEYNSFCEECKARAKEILNTQS